MKQLSLPQLQEGKIYRDTENNRLVKMENGVIKGQSGDSWVDLTNDLAFNGYEEVRTNSKDMPLREIYNAYLKGTAGNKNGLRDKVLARIISEIEELKGVSNE